MTTTGGPEPFLADPAVGNRSTDDPVLHVDSERLEGDDIVVEPGAPRPGSRRRRLATAGAVAGVLLVGGIAAAVADNHHSPSHASNLRAVATLHPPTAHPTPPTAAVKPKITQVKSVLPNASVTTTKTTSGNVAPPASIAIGSAETPTTTMSPPPPVTTPPVEPASVLEWSATPSELSVRAGAQMSVTVTVANPTNGTVTLGTPLSCEPTMRGPRGAVIGAFVCAQITQVIQPHARIAQRYTIHATDTGATSGKALTSGTYAATVENLFTIKVNVTNS
ncbi:MAG: hypothetical protein ACLPVY_20045 [Acidimicrobiia bacterium]